MVRVVIVAALFCRLVLPMTIKHAQYPVDTSHASSAIYEREFQPAPPGGWENQLDRPNWWRPENSMLPPKGAKIAIAFRGHYHRYNPGNVGISEGQLRHCDLAHGEPCCSDFWANTDNIFENLIDPLRALNYEVEIYFHTYRDPHCATYDEELVNALQPKSHKFDEALMINTKKQPYSFQEVLKLVQDDDWADVVVFSRFDVNYNAKITYWNVDWGRFNFPHMRSNMRANSDLIIILPKNMFDGYMSVPENKLVDHVVPDLEERFGKDCCHAVQDTPGPDKDDLPTSFLGVNRNCTKKYAQCASKAWQVAHG